MVRFPQKQCQLFVFVCVSRLPMLKGRYVYRGGEIIDLIVNRLLLDHLSLYTRSKPTCDKKIEIMDFIYIINQ